MIGAEDCAVLALLRERREVEEGSKRLNDLAVCGAGRCFMLEADRLVDISNKL